MKSALFTLSIDDGHPLDHKIAELLHRYNIPATFYVPYNNSEGHPVLQPQELRELAQQFEIGSHTHDHKALTQLTHKQAWEQIILGKDKLEEILGKTLLGFSYPLGEQYRIHRKMAKAAGFKYARTINNMHIETGHDEYALPTTLQFFPHQRHVLIRNYFKQGHLEQRYQSFKICLGQTSLLARVSSLFDFALHEQQVFHLWCHSLDIEQHNLWATLENFLSYVAEKTYPHQRLTNAELVNTMLATESSAVKNTEFA
jgi:hypothetical protein